MNDNERLAAVQGRTETAKNNEPPIARAIALTSFQDEMTEQVHFAVRKFGRQSVRECVATIRQYCDALEDTIPPAGDPTAEGVSIANKTERLNAALAIAVLAFRAHYGE